MSRRRIGFCIAASLAATLGCAGRSVAPAATARTVPPLPGAPGLAGPHVLALSHAPDGAVWAGTYGNGIYVLRAGSDAWEHIAAREGDSTSISWNFVNAFAHAADGSVWYGTVGNGFGRSTDGGRSWRNWGFSDLGPEWQYVAPDGMRARGDTVYVATADGLRLSWDGGGTWRCVQGGTARSGGAEGYDDRCAERITALPTEYLLALEVDRSGAIWVGHLEGVSVSRDGGRSWESAAAVAGVERPRIRAILADGDTVWAASEDALYRGPASRLAFDRVASVPGGVRALVRSAPGEPPLAATSRGVGRLGPAGFELLEPQTGYAPATDAWAGLALPHGGVLVGTATGVREAGTPAAGPWDQVRAAPPAVAQSPAHVWFRRPVAEAWNPYIDATYRYGSTMGGNFQQHQGVEFNNPAGTPVRAAGDGVVVFAGKAEAGANTVAILHDRRWEGQYVFTTYFHNTSLAVEQGQRVRAGDVIAHVGNTGRATNDHLHLEVHVAPTDDATRIVDPEVRFPPHTVNAQLWLEPLPGTGIVAGRVVDAAGRPVPGARVYGLVLPFPEETPFSFAETYRDRAHPDPAYGEHFAVGDVPAGDYLLGVEIEGTRVWRRVRVEPGKVSFVEFEPDPS